MYECVTVDFLSAEFAGDTNCEINCSAYFAVAMRYLGTEGCKFIYIIRIELYSKEFNVARLL